MDRKRDGGGLECCATAAYPLSMDTVAPRAPLTDEAVASRARRLAAGRLQEIEGNPLDADDLAMFEMFEREGWSHERRRAYILAGAAKLAAE
ncbi:MAG TPA: hypothetical protein VME47_01470 [Acetobacteraceae bacterium]|nr:hypothetical protein [Acetobacteraceae bacterium]